MERKKICYKIYIIDQVDEFSFNRAVLINIGFRYSLLDGGDYIIIHDIDMIPINEELNYEYPESGPYHISDPRIHPLYHYKNFIGGVLAISNSDFIKVNGMSNEYWGWGREDDDLFRRFKKLNIPIIREKNYSFSNKSYFIHDHLKNEKRAKSNLRKNTQVTFVYNKILRSRSFHSGLSNVDFSLLRIRTINSDLYTYTLIQVILKCSDFADSC